MPLPVFKGIPEIGALGRERLHSLCEEWCQTPIAKENCVSRVNIADDLTISPTFKLEWEVWPQLTIDLRSGDVQDTSYTIGAPENGQEVFFPCDNLLRFIVNRSFDDPLKAKLLRLIETRRRRVGREVFQSFRVNRK